MEISINSNNELDIIMKDKDVVNISTTRIGNKNQIKCVKGILHFDTLSTNEINALKMEKQALKAMDKYLQRRKKFDEAKEKKKC